MEGLVVGYAYEMPRYNPSTALCHNQVSSNLIPVAPHKIPKQDCNSIIPLASHMVHQAQPEVIP